VQVAKLNLSSFFQLVPNEMVLGLPRPPKRQTAGLSDGQNLPTFPPMRFSPASNPESVPFPRPNKETPDKPPKNQSANTVNGHH
jgi:hypothetical protein